MKTKIFLSVVALGAASAAFANGSNLPPTPAANTAEANYFDGFYIGAGGDMQHSTGNIKNDSTNSLSVGQSATINHTLSVDRDFGDIDFGGDVNIGYGKTFNIASFTYYAGVELYTQYAYANSDANETQTFTNIIYSVTTLVEDVSTEVNLKSDFSYGGRLKLGYLIAPKSMLYILAGIEYTKFDVNASRDVSTVNSRLLSRNYSFSQNEFGFVPGIGIETMFSDKLSVKAQYTHAIYPRLTHHNNFATSANLSGKEFVVTDSSDDRIDVSHGVFTLGLTYHFNKL